MKKLTAVTLAALRFEVFREGVQALSRKHETIRCKTEARIVARHPARAPEEGP